MQKPFVILAVSVAALCLPPAGSADDHAEGIKKWFESYDAAFNAKDLTRLAGFYHPDVTIFEEGSADRSWANYRDNHLGPELKEFQTLEFAHVDVTPHLLSADGKTAYVTAEYRLKARMQSRDVEAAGVATFVLVKNLAGAWEIRHSHTSSRRRPSALTAPPPRRP